MSWSVSVEGTREDVVTRIDEQVSIPQSVKDALPGMLVEFSSEKKVTVSTHGHHDGKGGGNSTLTVSTLTVSTSD